MARKLLTDWAIGKAIIDGDHDADLHIIEQAVRARRKMLDRVEGARLGCRAAYDGREGVVMKINPKTYLIHFDGDNDWTAYTVTKSAVRIIPLPLPACIENLRALGLDARGRELPLDIPVYDAANGARLPNAPLEA